MTRMPKLTALALALGLVAGCSSDSDPPPAGTTSSSVEAVELTVFAASSLTGAFEQIATDFEGANAGVTVTYNFGPSDGLAGQIQSEGTADVFASASGTWMDAVQEDPGVSDRTNFATNELVVVTPADNPAGIGTFEDIAATGVQLVLAAEGVPVGDYAREALENAGISEDALANVVSNEEDNASVVAKVVAGEADAAIVYTSDVSAAAGNDLVAVEIPEEVNVIAAYPIAVVTGADAGDASAAFVAYVLGDGQAVLQDYGFGPAPAD
ncbi:MAG: molybdate ABC transporter substrate-binding protein [Actinomycetota bacterium]